MMIKKLLKTLFCLILATNSLHNDCGETAVAPSCPAVAPLPEPALALSAMPDQMAPAQVTSMPAQLPEASLPEQMQKHRLLAEALFEYAHQASKSLERIPSLIARTKAFINESLALLARLSTDMKMVPEQNKKVKHAPDSIARLSALTEVVTQLIPCIQHLAQLSLSSAELIYAMNDQLLQPFARETAEHGMKTCIEIREMVRSIADITASLQDMSKSIKQ